MSSQLDLTLLDLTLLDGDVAVVQLGPDAPFPSWLPAEGFVSVTRTLSELSIVCATSAVPPDGPAAGGLTCESGWRMIRFEGPFEFSLTGVLASVLKPLAAAGVGIFAVSTYDTDYLLVKAADLERAAAALTAAGHRGLAPNL